MSGLVILGPSFGRVFVARSRLSCLDHRARFEKTGMVSAGLDLCAAAPYLWRKRHGRRLRTRRSSARRQGESMAQPEFDELAETFDFLDNWEDRYRHVIEMGRDLAPMAEALKVPANKVNGCASQVWVFPRIAGAGGDARFDFLGDSDAMIVRGLIAVLHTLYAGRPVAEVPKIDALAELKRLGLDEHLSSQRSNGVRAMVARLRAEAQTHLDSAHA
jgi:cysteine desulfuration protein SufE